eukprot:5283121-Amphidinium_carterae.2
MALSPPTKNTLVAFNAGAKNCIGRMILLIGGHSGSVCVCVCVCLFALLGGVIIISNALNKSGASAEPILRHTEYATA